MCIYGNEQYQLVFASLIKKNYSFLPLLLIQGLKSQKLLWKEHSEIIVDNLQEEHFRGL